MSNESGDSIRVIITGTTGMVGEGVLQVCLENPAVEAVLIVNRKPLGVIHPKLTEIIHSNFYDLSPIETSLKGYNACYFCLGISSVGMKEADYFKITHTLTMHVAGTLSRLNQQMVFCYVSGAGTDSTEKGRSMWARVKGKTENDLNRIPFAAEYNFRPGFIRPVRGQKNVHTFYKFIDWLFPIGRRLYSNGFVHLRELGLAMIAVTRNGFPKPVVDGNDIIALAAGN